MSKARVIRLMSVKPNNKICDGLGITHKNKNKSIQLFKKCYIFIKFWTFY